MWAELRKSTRNSEPSETRNRKKPLPFPGLKGRKNETMLSEPESRTQGVPSGQEPLFRDATTTRAETPKQNESGEETL